MTAANRRSFIRPRHFYSKDRDIDMAAGDEFEQVASNFHHIFHKKSHGFQKDCGSI